MIKLNERWRVIESGEEPPYNQWKLQRLSFLKGKEVWLSQSYCQTRKALLTDVQEKIVQADEFYQGSTSMPVDEAALAEVKALPERVF